MSISRRQFILGTGAGLILPAYYDKVFTFFENHGESIIEAPKQALNDLYAVNWNDCFIEFHLGEVQPEAPGPMTIREFAIRYFGDEQGYLDAYCCERDGIEVDFDAIQDPVMLENTWLRRDSPMARAYRLLENLDLGPDLNGKDAVGQIDFLDAPNMYSWYLGVQTEDPLSVSLLQKRLNDLNTGVRYDHTPSEWAEHLRRMGGAGMSLPASIAARLQSPEPPQEQGPAQDSGPRRSRKWPLDFVALSLNE